MTEFVSRIVSIYTDAASQKRARIDLIASLIGGIDEDSYKSIRASVIQALTESDIDPKTAKSETSLIRTMYPLVSEIGDHRHGYSPQMLSALNASVKNGIHENREDAYRDVVENQPGCTLAQLAAWAGSTPDPLANLKQALRLIETELPKVSDEDRQSFEIALAAVLEA